MSHIMTLDIGIKNVVSLDAAANTMGFKKMDSAEFEAFYENGNQYFGIAKDGSFKTDTYYFKNVNQLKAEYGKEEILRLSRMQGLTVKSCAKNSQGEYQIELLKI